MTCFATIDDVDPSLIIAELERSLRAGGFDPQRLEGPPVRFYGTNVLLLNPSGHRLLSVRYGGRNGRPFVECKGMPSACVAATLREWFEHLPARLDSAYDLASPTAFFELEKIAHDFETRLGLKIDYAGARSENLNRGTTIYLGSRKSQAFVRIYQKGLQIAEEMGLTGDRIPEELSNWVRVELEYKPDKRPARIIASTLSPAALWGCSPWTRDFVKLALSVDAQRVRMSEHRESNQDRAMRYLVQQYGPTIVRQEELLGSWQHFLADLQQRLGVDETASSSSLPSVSLL